MKSLTQEQRRALLTELGALSKDPNVDQGMVLALEVLTLTGMRSCELYRLTIDRLDVERGIVTVRAAKGSLDHPVPLDKAVITRLKAHCSTNGTFWPRHTEDTALRQLRAFWERYRVLLLGTNVQHVGLHGLRAAFLQQLYTKGGIMLCQQLAGHKSLSSTARYMQAVDVYSARQKIMNFLK